jgi:hypothetical protein
MVYNSVKTLGVKTALSRIISPERKPTVSGRDRGTERASMTTFDSKSMLGMKKIDIAGIESPSRMTPRTLRLAHSCAKKPSRHRARQKLALR